MKVRQCLKYGPNKENLHSWCIPRALLALLPPLSTLCRASGCLFHEHLFVTTSYTLQLTGFTLCFSLSCCGEIQWNGKSIIRCLSTPALKMSLLGGVEHAVLHFTHLALPLSEYEVNNFSSHQIPSLSESNQHKHHNSS